MQLYLVNRKHFVSVNGADSSKLALNLKHGEHQGNILGALLFMICINDIPEAADIARFNLYADEASILILTTDT